MSSCTECKLAIRYFQYLIYLGMVAFHAGHSSIVCLVQGRKGTGGSGASSSGRSIEQFPMGTKLSVQLDARSDRWLARLAQAARNLRRAGYYTLFLRAASPSI